MKSAGSVIESAWPAKRQSKAVWRAASMAKALGGSQLSAVRNQ